MRAIVSYILFGIASSASDTFRFTQCDCPGFRFSSQQKINFPNPFEISGSADVFKCPGDSEFPETSGVLRLSGSSAGGLATSQVRRELFQDSLNGERKAWHAAIRSSFSPLLGAQFDLISILDEDIEIYTISTSVFTFGDLPNVRFIINGEKLDFPTKEPGEVDCNVIFGETFNASINDGANTFDGAYICVSMGDEDFECTFSDGVMPELSSVSIRLLHSDSTSVVLPTKLSMAHFESNGVNDVHVSQEAEFLTQLRNFSERTLYVNVPEVISLPVEDNSGFILKTDENVEMAFDLLSLLTTGTVDLGLLTFSITDYTNNGFLSGGDEGSPLFKYFPLQDFTGTDGFSFNYAISSPFLCSNSISASITVKNPFNPPVAQNLVVDVYAGVPEIISVLVAKDLDEPDGNMNGRLLISSSSGGHITETCEGQNIATVLAVTNGMASFCYSPFNSMINGQIASLLFIVIDGDDFSDDGSITFKGNIPIVLAPEPPIKVGLEDSTLVFSLGDDVFGRRVKSTFDEVPIGIRITKLPNPSRGILFDSNENIVDTSTYSDFFDHESLRFVPNVGVFNSFDELPVGPSGEPIGICENRVLGNASHAYCEISFEYKIFFAEVESDSQKAFFLIDAVDDGKPIISIGNTVVSGKSAFHSSNEVKLSSPSIKITSDAGASLFQIRMQIRGLGGLLFRVLLPTNSIGITFPQQLSTFEGNDDCTKALCNTVIIVATPLQLEEVVRILDIQNSGDLSQLFLSLEVVESNSEFGSGSRILIPASVTAEKASKNRKILLKIGTGLGFFLGLSLITYCRASERQE